MEMQRQIFDKQIFARSCRDDGREWTLFSRYFELSLSHLVNILCRYFW